VAKTKPSPYLRACEASARVLCVQAVMAPDGASVWASSMTSRPNRGGHLCNRWSLKQDSVSYTRTLQFPSEHTNAAAESFFSTLEHGVLSRHHFKTRQEAEETIAEWVVNFSIITDDVTVPVGMQYPIGYA
jgi:hypothetical protein